MDELFAPFDPSAFGGDSPSLTNMALLDVFKNKPLPPHSSHPNFGHLTVLVFQAVLEVVFVAAPGYILARRGMFDASAQKFLAELNVNLFTPCLSTLLPSSQLCCRIANGLQSSTNCPHSSGERISQAWPSSPSFSPCRCSCPLAAAPS
jgi:hypothetical protein